MLEVNGCPGLKLSRRVQSVPSKEDGEIVRYFVMGSWVYFHAFAVSFYTWCLFDFGPF